MVLKCFEAEEGMIRIDWSRLMDLIKDVSSQQFITAPSVVAASHSDRCDNYGASWWLVIETCFVHFSSTLVLPMVGWEQRFCSTISLWVIIPYKTKATLSLTTSYKSLFPTKSSSLQNDQGLWTLPNLVGPTSIPTKGRFSYNVPGIRPFFFYNFHAFLRFVGNPTLPFL